MNSNSNSNAMEFSNYGGTSEINSPQISNGSYNNFMSSFAENYKQFNNLEVPQPDNYDNNEQDSSNEHVENGADIEYKDRGQLEALLLRENILNTIKYCKKQKFEDPLSNTRLNNSDVFYKNFTINLEPDSNSQNNDVAEVSVAESDNNEESFEVPVVAQESLPEIIRACDIKQEVTDDFEQIPSDVQIKVEQLTDWTDIDYNQPFLKDMNAVTCNDESYRTVEAEESVAEATAMLKKETCENTYFECPHCELLFDHHKRLLIHSKWHSFGQIRTKKKPPVVTKNKVTRHRKKTAQLQEKIDAKKTKAPSSPPPADESARVPCKDCDKTFNNKSDLKYHRYRTHSTHTHECKKCGKTIYGFQAFRTHLATHADEMYQCSDCPKTFKFYRSLIKHRGTHMEKTHECDRCPKKFGSDELLKIHYKYHLQQDAAYKCNKCSRGFSDSDEFEAHVKSHKKEKKFFCDICDTGFVRQCALKKHLEVCHNSTPHLCSICGRSFQSPGLRNRHETRSHKKELVIKCDHCSRRYKTQEDLDKHMHKEHWRAASKA